MNESKQTKKCPYCAEYVLADAIRCRYCNSWLNRRDSMLEWKRSRKFAKLTGVCAGLAQQFQISVTFIRLAFVIMTFFSGIGIVLYLALWILMPWDEPDIH